MPIEVPDGMLQPCLHCRWPIYPVVGGGWSHMPRRYIGFARRRCRKADTRATPSHIGDTDAR